MWLRSWVDFLYKKFTCFPAESLQNCKIEALVWGNKVLAGTIEHNVTSRFARRGISTQHPPPHLSTRATAQNQRRRAGSVGCPTQTYPTLPHCHCLGACTPVTPLTDLPLNSPLLQHPPLSAHAAARHLPCNCSPAKGYIPASNAYTR